MANVFIEENTMVAIGEAIRAKTGKTDKILPADMPGEIEGITGGGSGGGDPAVEAALIGVVERTAETIILPEVVTSIGKLGFYQNTVVKRIEAPFVTSVGQYAIQNCTALEEVYFPSLETIVTYGFNGCNKIKNLKFPSVTEILAYGIAECYGIESIDFPKSVSFKSQALYFCSRATKILLRSETMCTAENRSMFSGCYHLTGSKHATYNPNSLKDCYIYVPKALVDTYNSDANWSIFAGQYRALEDYTVDGTITGELDESKI